MSISLLIAQAGQSDLALGLVQFDSVYAPTGGKGEIVPWIVVEAINDKTGVRSFGLTNEAGILPMPLPPGKYEFRAFSREGKRLRVTIREANKYFTVAPGEFVEVGVEILSLPGKAPPTDR